MKILDIYKKYQIMRNLQEHQLRVAAVASLICDNFAKPLDKKSIATACLLHDMGNIIKFKLDLFPEFLEPEGLEYWQGVKEKFIKKYGPNEHQATYKIAQEVGVSKRIFELIKAFGFSKSPENSRHQDFEKKICAYSDHRVSPHGIESLEEKNKKGMERFAANKNIKDLKKHQEENAYLYSFMEKIEKQIFAHCRLRPEEITNQSVNPLVEKLKDFELGDRTL